MATYSFLDTVANINGPGGNFNMGANAGIAEEGISIEPSADLNNMAIGAGGDGQHSLSANRSGKLLVRTLKTSPLNAQLQTMLNLQRSSSLLHGNNTIIIGNVMGDHITCQQCAFSKQPTINYAAVAGMNEWSFDSILIDFTLGGALLNQLLAAAGAGSVIADALG
jgi:hypothetical protein